MNKRVNIEPELPERCHESPFRVPARYFDDFPARMQHRIEQELQVAAPPRRKIIEMIRPALALAAGFAAVFLLVYVPMRLFPPSQLANQVNGNMPDDYTTIVNLVENFDDQTFFAMLSDEYHEETLDQENLEAWLKANNSDYDIYLEIQK